ncbi:MAG: hypothetical protein LUQ31_07685, partial [Methanoregula sp.]|nr:hypothetical protein [Methanoregula sp.]
DMPFDAMLYRDHDAFALRVRTAGKSPGEYDLWEEFFREDFEILRTLPMPPGIGRELWVRYTWTRKFHRYRLVDQHFSELTMIDRELPRFNPEKTPGNNHNPGKAER